MEFYTQIKCTRLNFKTACFRGSNHKKDLKLPDQGVCISQRILKVKLGIVHPGHTTPKREALLCSPLNKASELGSTDKFYSLSFHIQEFSLFPSTPFFLQRLPAV